MDYLKNAAWDGNIRELRNVIETAIILAQRETLDLGDFSSEFQASFADSEIDSDPDTQMGIPVGLDTPDNQESSVDTESDKVGTVGMTMEDIEKEAIRKTLAETGNNKKRAAEMLGIGLRDAVPQTGILRLAEQKRPRRRSKRLGGLSLLVGGISQSRLLTK